MIAVTGSVGKTSTKDLIAALVAPHRTVAASRANFNTEIGLPLEVLAAPPGTEVLVLELAMRGFGQIAELTAICQPDVGVITNIGPVHLEQMGSLEGVAEAKAELIDGLQPGGTAVVPSDEPLLEPWLRDDLDIVTFGPAGDVHYEGASIKSGVVPDAVPTKHVVIAQGERVGGAMARLRKLMFDAFRDPAYTTVQDIAIPPMYGDEVTIPGTTPEQFLAVTKTQYQMLMRWRDGDFIPGLPVPGPRDLAEVPVPLQPSTLDRASLEACLGGAFHPGCEATWPVRIASMYAAPYRLRVAPPGAVEPDYGDTLTPEAALSSTGPLTMNYPGSLSRWMAVPWQADTASCRSGYEPQIDPYLPTFWAARVPNHILTESAYRTVMDVKQPRAVRVAAFYDRANWLRNIVDDDKIASLQRMVDSWYLLGIVNERPGPPDLFDLPQLMKVETANEFTTPAVMKRAPTWGLRNS